MNDYTIVCLSLSNAHLIDKFYSYFAFLFVEKKQKKKERDELCGERINWRLMIGFGARHPAEVAAINGLFGGEKNIPVQEILRSPNVQKSFAGLTYGTRQRVQENRRHLSENRA